MKICQCTGRQYEVDVVMRSDDVKRGDFSYIDASSSRLPKAGEPYIEFWHFKKVQKAKGCPIDHSTGRFKNFVKGTPLMLSIGN